MLGAIIGDIVGSRFEFDNHKSKDFEFFSGECEFTDDTVMTLAIAKALLSVDPSRTNGTLYRSAITWMRKLGREYPYCSYGNRFSEWLFYDGLPRPYGSYGNGAGMRVSPVAWVATSESNCVHLSETVTRTTHSHPDGIKGAEAIAIATFLALHGSSKDKIRERIERDYYPLDFTLDEIRNSYRFDETCQGTIPQAIEAFLESTDFEDAIRNAISIGGDSDTLAACTGAIAEAYYGIPQAMREEAKTYLDRRLLQILEEFEEAYPPKIGE
jgi:type I restriction enzyme M protein